MSGLYSLFFKTVITIEQKHEFLSFLGTQNKALQTLSFQLDGLTVPFLILLVFLCVAKNRASLPTDNEWFILSFILSSFYAVISANPILFLLFFEASSFFLFLYAYYQEKGSISALRFFKYSVFSFICLVVGVLLIDLNFIELGMALITLGIMAKAPVPPLNGWQVDAYATCNPFSVLCMSVILSKLPFLFLFRFFDVGGFESRNFLVWLVVIGGLIAGLSLIRERESVKKLALISSVHMAVNLGAILSNQDLALSVFPLFVLGHGIMLGYVIYKSRLNLFTPAWIIANLALLAQPLSLIFWADIGGLVALFKASYYLSLIAGFSLFIAAISVLPNLRIPFQRRFTLLDFFVFISFAVGFTPLIFTAEIAPKMLKIEGPKPSSFDSPVEGVTESI
ncbi:MAG: proton-conducting transporter membrane subunit [Deltaproteobacteria bacterium]|nr:proton-conducting transporter membrane subunit [Deltaproteobacteria bacterium]